MIFLVKKMSVKLEALLCSRRLRIFEVNGTRNYLGFAEIDQDFTEKDIEYVAVMVYSKAAHPKKAPKIEVEITYQK